MTQEFNYQEAIQRAMLMARDLMEFYQRAALITKDPGGQKVFESLAHEERLQADSLYRIYHGREFGNFEEFIGTPSHSTSVMMHELEKALNERVDERHAMDIALREEESLEKSLRYTASKLVDPASRLFFERMASETHNHCQVLGAEYARLMGMVHDTDMDTYVRE